MLFEAWKQSFSIALYCVRISVHNCLHFSYCEFIIDLGGAKLMVVSSVKYFGTILLLNSHKI